jgi:hypothetical protein
MNESDVIRVMLEHVSRQFPKKCSCCGKQYASLAEYLRSTTHVGKPVSLDADMGDWQPKEPLGVISCAACSCGTTMAISSDGMGLITLLQLMNWARKETKLRGIGMRELLEDLRTKIDKIALQETNGSGHQGGQGTT